MPTQAGIDKYTSLLINLLPQGRLWRPREQPTFLKFLKAVATEFCRVEERVTDALKEADPRESFEILDDWERLLGIPDECTETDRSLSERRQQIVQKLTNVGGLSAEFYEFICAQLGFQVTVENRVNFLAGRGRAGDALWNYFNRHFVAGSPAGMALTEIGWRFYFNVEMPVTAVEVFEAGDVAGTPLREFTNPLIECTIRKLKPAHAGVTFTFKE
jgi:uncharacterized protein YmfQ (DUF2313 family)